MKVLDILKKFKQDIKLELDIYDEESYVNMINKINTIKGVINNLMIESQTFNLEKCFYITNIKDSDLDENKPYIISALDYDTLGVEIDYNLLMLLRVDLSIYKKELENQNIKKIKDKQIVLNHRELERVFDSIVKKLEEKIKVIDFNDEQIVDTYINICKLYDEPIDNNKVVQQINNDIRKQNIKLFIDNIKSSVSNFKMMLVISVKMYIDDIVDVYKSIENSYYSMISGVKIFYYTKIKKRFELYKIIKLFKKLEKTNGNFKKESKQEK